MPTDCDLTVAQCAAIVRIVSRRQDPIYRGGKETTILRVAASEGDKRADTVFVTYHTLPSRKKARTSVYSYMQNRIKSYRTEAS